MSQITKNALAKALMTLLEKKTLDKITVQEIADLCGVNRQTFYYHFQDIYSLLDWIFITEAEHVVSTHQSIETWQQDFLAIFEYLQRNKPFIINTYRSIGRDFLEQYLYKAVYGFIYDVVKNEADRKNIPQGDIEFFADFYKFAFVGLVLEWVRTGMKEPPTQIVGRVAKLFERIIGQVAR
jgi:probable dihydroxyacetone kinase regulator